MSRFADLPVCIELPGALGQEVTRFVESEAGWHVVAPGGPLRPALTVADHVGPGPCVVVLPGAADATSVRDAMLAGAVDVVAWPADRDRLLDAPRRLRREPLGRSGPGLLRIAGARGGAGTSTIALTVAAAVAWSGGRALVVGGDDLTALAGVGVWRGAGATEVAALGEQAAEEIGGLAVAVDGVRGLAVLGGGAAVSDVAGWPYDLVVLDTRTDGLAQAQVVVGCADATVRRIPREAAALVVDHGPLDRAAVVRCLGRQPHGWLPHSARVARVGSAGRVPSALPGSWVSAVRTALAAPRRAVSRAAV